MTKLTKKQTKFHNEAKDILKKDVLTTEEKEFVLNNYLPAAEHNATETGTFFTSENNAQNFYAVTLPEGRILDLCAGIGRLAYTVSPPWKNNEIVCVESNPVFVEIGKKILPHATWICGDAFDPDFYKTLAQFDFDCVIANPPFGLRGDKPQGYGSPAEKWVRSGRSECWVIEIAMKLSDYGCFILPKGMTSYDREKKEYQKSWLENSLRKYYPEISVNPASVDLERDFHLTNLETEVVIVHREG